jgi:polyisoprenoid-binding protein YceI
MPRILFFAFGLAAALGAQPVVVTLDPAGSRVEFTLGATLHTVRGTFKLKSGTIRFDPATGAAEGEVIVDAASGVTGNGSRDGKMHREVLESERYPDIVFAPSRVSGHLKPEGESKLQVEGTLTLHGSPKPVTLDAVVQITGDRMTALTRLVVPYVQWGLKNPSTLFLRVSDKVDLTLHAAGRVAVQTP